MTSHKDKVLNAAKCLPSEANIEYVGSDEDGVMVDINGFSFTLDSDECIQSHRSLVGIHSRTYEGWSAVVYDDEGNDHILSEISEIETLESAICECYLWTIRHIFDNKSQDEAIYSDWVLQQEMFKN